MANVRYKYLTWLQVGNLIEIGGSKFHVAHWPIITRLPVFPLTDMTHGHGHGSSLAHPLGLSNYICNNTSEALAYYYRQIITELVTLSGCIYH